MLILSSRSVHLNFFEKEYTGVDPKTQKLVKEMYSITSSRPNFESIFYARIA